ncbi:hypothetical protein ACIBO6_02020 [Streptomyces luteogriseus]|uniref:hypothetical protein n=1 Tax=Streptomyces luteogriseus TaxID=68233 RepID=UPI00379F8669
MYTMRPATPGDRPTITELVATRYRWMRDNWIDTSSIDRESACDLAGSSGEDGRPLVWLLHDGPQLLGCTVLLDTLQDYGWTTAHRRESSLLMFGTFSHPARSGDQAWRWMSLWAVDYASRIQGVLWLRKLIRSHRLMCQARDQHGWDLIDTVIHHGRRAHLMQRRVAPVPCLDQFISPAPLTANATAS